MEAEIVSKAKMGDQNAIADLLRLYDPLMTKFANRLCATREDAEDSIQHARMVTAFKLSTFRGLAKISTWLFAIIKNECYRMQMKMFGTSLHEAPAPALLDYPNLDAEMDRRKLIDRVSEGINKLEPDAREIIVLKDLEDLSLQEIAAQLALSLPAVKSRLHRSRQLLKADLESKHIYSHLRLTP